MEPVEVIQARSTTCEVIGADFNSQIGEEIQRLISVPPETGSSFTALLELPANRAMELLVHLPEDAAATGGAENPCVTLASEQIHQCRPPPPVAPPIFPSDTALVERASKFSSIMSSDENSRAKLEVVKEEPLDSVSNPNSNSSPAASNLAVDQNPKSTKRKDREKKGKESNKKSKKPANESSDDGGDKLPYVHVRARRGQATDSHSLAERARREKINARMKLLQELVPGCNKGLLVKGCFLQGSLLLYLEGWGVLGWMFGNVVICKLLRAGFLSLHLFCVLLRSNFAARSYYSCLSCQLDWIRILAVGIIVLASSV